MCKAAEGQPCMVKSPVCNSRTATTVLAHENSSDGGKGMSIKSHDHHSIFACSACHDYYDKGPASRGEKVMIYAQSQLRHGNYCWRTGIFRVDMAAAKRVRHYE